MDSRQEETEEELAELYRKKSQSKRIHLQSISEYEQEIERLIRVYAATERALDTAAHEIRTLRIENKRLLKLIQEQDKLIRASDTATEIKLADKLAEVLQKVDRGQSAPYGQVVYRVLNEWKTVRGIEFTDNTLNSGKRVS